MNRKQRRSVEKRLQGQLRTHSLKHPVPDSVTLLGGPMDGWVVKPDAPALLPDWYRTWPPDIAAANEPGRYVLEGREATWSPLE